MKVCHLTSAHESTDVRIFRKECVSLAAAGYETYLVARGESREDYGVHVVGVGPAPEGRLQRMTTFARTVYRRALELDADLYHIHDPELLPYARKLKQRGKKVIFDSHENVAETILEKDYILPIVRKGIYKAYRKYQENVCRKLDAVVTVTPNIVRYFEKICSHVVQVTNFPIFEKEVLSPDFGAKRMVFAGGISAQWNHLRIVEALLQLPDYRYCLCGTGNDTYIGKLQLSQGWKQVEYLGKISHEEVAKELASSSVGMALLLPNRNSDWKNGTIGNTKIFEEMMAGLPVVCTDFVLWKEFVGRYHCGICVNPENIEDIVQAVCYLGKHPEEARQMGENGRRAVEEEFNWKTQEARLLALYRELLGE